MVLESDVPSYRTEDTKKRGTNIDMEIKSKEDKDTGKKKTRPNGPRESENEPGPDRQI